MIVRDHDDGAGLVRSFVLDRPARRNALDRSTLRSLRDALRGLAGEVRAVVLTGADGWFSAGADLAELHGDVRDLDYDKMVAEVTTALTDVTVPVVAGIEGGCLGAALDLVASCDLVVCDRDAVLAVPAVRLGLLYNPAALARLARRLTPGLVSRLLLTGAPVCAEDAARGGLVDVLVDAEAAAEATRLAGVIAANESAAVQATLGLLRACRTGPPDLDAWESIRRELLASPARRRAVAVAQARTGRRNPT